MKTLHVLTILLLVLLCVCVGGGGGTVVTFHETLLHMHYMYTIGGPFTGIVTTRSIQLAPEIFSHLGVITAFR